MSKPHSATTDAAIGRGRPAAAASSVEPPSAATSEGAGRPAALCGIRLDPSALLVALYLVMHDGLRVVLMRYMPGADADCGNQPCWRSALMMWPQVRRGALS